MHTTMVPEQVKTMKIQAGIQVSRPGELRRQLQLWKRFGRFYLIVFVLVSNIELGKDVTKNTSKSVSVKGRKGSTFQKVSCSKSTKTKAFKDLKFFDDSSSDDQGNVFRGVMNSDDTLETGKDVTKTTSKSVSVKGRKDDQGNVFRGVVRGKPVESDVELKVVSVPDDVDAKRLPPVRNCILGLASSRTWQKIVQNDFGIKNYAELGKKLLQVKKVQVKAKGRWFSISMCWFS
ncbi:hypothetical protein Tco_1485831 [Tanacetum coccineum]